MNLAETVALGAVALFTGSVAMRAQTAANAADMAVQVFLLIGVVSSARPADASHPLGYGRERFFWSYLAALGIFVGGGGLGLEGAFQSALHPVAVTNYELAYAVLVTIIAMDAFALRIVLRPLRTAAARRGVSLLTHLKRSTDSVAVTIVVGGACAVIGSVVAGAGLVTSQFMGSATPDTVASALIGLLLLVASVLLLHTHRELLTGRGVPPAMTSEMRRVVAAQPGVLDVPDLFAVVIGPASLIVVGDVTFADELDVPRVEAMIMRAANELRERWPAIDYVYLTPVPQARFSRRAPWLRPRAAAHRSPGPPLRGRPSGPAGSRPGVARPARSKNTSAEGDGF